MPQILRFISFALLLLCFQKSEAQRFPFFNLKVENGLVQSQVTCLNQDKFGNLWIGTLGGLSRYDGNKLKNYTVSDGLYSNNIVAIQFAPLGDLLISTGKSLQSFDGQKFVSITNKNNTQGVAVSNICTSPKGNIYCLQAGLLHLILLQEKKLIALDSSEYFSSIQFIDNKLIASNTNGSVVEIDERNFKHKIPFVQNPDSTLTILKIFKDSKKQFWILSNKGLFVIKNNVIEPFKVNGQTAINIPIFKAAEDNNGHIWLASYQGAFRIRDTVINYFNQKNGLSNNIIYDALRDNEGNIWLGTDGEGVFRYSGGPFISIDEGLGLPNKQVTGIAGNGSDEIFFSSYQGKLSTYQLGSTVKTIENPELKNDIITGIQYQKNRGLWIATRSNGLFLRANNGRIEKINNKQYPQANNITSLYIDNESTLYVGLIKDMLRIEGKEIKQYSLGGLTPLCFTNVGKDSLLIATNNGIHLLRNNAVTRWNTNSILDSVVVQCMIKCKQRLFIGTAEKGIIVYNFKDKSQQTINSKNGLRSDFIYNIIKDDSNNVWAGTGMGICKISEERNKSFNIIYYGKANGIIGLESNSNASYADNSGHIWFGTTEGVSCFFSSAKPTKSKPISIILESVHLFGGIPIDKKFYTRNTGWYNTPEGLDLPYRFNSLSFSFQAITLSPVDKVLYRYILDGASKNWSEWSEENTINFSSLEPGNYTLKVMCQINNKVQEKVLLSYSFSIKTPFHKSIWFIISTLGLAIMAGVYLQYSTNKRKLKRIAREESLRKEEQNRIRERTAEDFHDEVGNKLTRINVLTNVLKSKLNSTNNDAERIIQQIQDNSQQLYAGTRDILWSLQPSNDNLYEIINHISDLANEMFSETHISFSLFGNDESLKDYKMPLDKSRNFIMIWKEALNNCMKYAEANHVSLQVSNNTEHGIRITLTDDGKGFDKTLAQQGNGLKNMNTRAQRLNATLDIISNNGGSQIILNLPLKNKFYEQ